MMLGVPELVQALLHIPKVEELITYIPKIFQFYETHTYSSLLSSAVVAISVLPFLSLSANERSPSSSSSSSLLTSLAHK